MADKQIFAALEAADHEVRLVVGEFFNTRFNILKVERVACDGVSYNGVTNADAVTAAIRKALDACRKQLGAEIKKVITAVAKAEMTKGIKKINNKEILREIVENTTGMFILNKEMFIEYFLIYCSSIKCISNKNRTLK